MYRVGGEGVIAGRGREPRSNFRRLSCR